ncbi:hypothetical protein DPMN_149752 [Dreissena polymorpha]|jgi:hypothetical protein|uniref:Uncharacterized protein n=1 Tax=Dreissena polymorpha TaxID=45954 RepID=A0A9D4FGK6_DREPO|nr:hypothetical protein DPMN_149752 [Dreissena polymorpha]
MSLFGFFTETPLNNELLKGVFINSAYESNKHKCSDAYIEHFLYNDSMDMPSTVSRIKEICSSHMLPIRDIECNANKLYNIKCEDFDSHIEIENTGPYPFSLADEVYVLPPIPNQCIDLERLKMQVSPRFSCYKPILVPKFEIANIYEDIIKSFKNEKTFSSILFKTFTSIGNEMAEMIISGCQFTPCGYVLAKSGHEPPNIRSVQIKPFQKFVMKVVKPCTFPMPDLFKLLCLVDPNDAMDLE